MLLFYGGCSSSVRFGREGSGNGQGKETTEPETVKPNRTPRDSNAKPLLTVTGVASFYADAFHNRKTSNGETYDMNDFTCAHRNFPFQTRIRVTNLDNDMTVIVRVNDRGPFAEGRIIDLSLGAAKALNMVEKGTTKIKLEILEWGNGK
jgi:rare lipoprotein A